MVIRHQRFLKHISFSMGAQKKTWRSTLVSGWATPIDGVAHRTGECYRNENFGFAGSLVTLSVEIL